MASEWFEQKEFQSASEFLDALSPRSNTWGATWESGPFIFRGQANDDWPLLPSAFRAKPWEALEGKDPATLTESEREDQEQELLWRFGEGLDREGLPVPGGHLLLSYLNPRTSDASSGQWPREYADLLALAQHHGLPTRLLDFTRRGIVAAYFAGLEAEADARSMAIWALRQSLLNEIHRFGGAWFNLIRASRASNPNLHAQSGVFVTWTEIEEVLPLHEIVKRVINRNIAVAPAACLDSPLPVLIKFTLPRSEAPELLRLLALEGITGASMFPGTDGIVRELKERRLRAGSISTRGGK